MNTELALENALDIYPGEYMPSPALKAWLTKERKKLEANISTKPPVNFNEHEQGYKIEVFVPGVKREDIFVYVKDSQLTIILLHRNSEELKQSLQIHTFENECLERNITLPNNADPELMCAEYKDGILLLHIPKANESPKSINKRIVVY